MIHHALCVTDDQPTLRLILPRMIEIYERHVQGTRFHIGMDPTDGLIRQGEEVQCILPDQRVVTLEAQETAGGAA